jgi:hypothetical protein
MCSLKDILAIGFSNGVLLLLDTDKLEIVFSHKNFTKNDKPIDKMKVFLVGDGRETESTALLLSLSDGLLSYHTFPKVTLIDELIMEANIIDFQPYDSPHSTGRRCFLATIH